MVAMDNCFKTALTVKQLKLAATERAMFRDMQQKTNGTYRNDFKCP